MGKVKEALLRLWKNYPLEFIEVILILVTIFAMGVAAGAFIQKFWGFQWG